MLYTEILSGLWIGDVDLMYNKKFIAALFSPQPVYTNKSVRQVFDRLAHSSIMRLNENSMDNK